MVNEIKSWKNLAVHLQLNNEDLNTQLEFLQNFVVLISKVTEVVQGFLCKAYLVCGTLLKTRASMGWIR